MRTSDQTRPETLLCSHEHIFADMVILPPAVLAQEERPFSPPVGRSFLPSGACAQNTPVWHLLTAHGWKASPALSVHRTPELFQFFTASAVDAVDHAMIILQRHFSGAEDCPFRLFLPRQRPCAVSHDKILSIIGNMVDAVTGASICSRLMAVTLKAAPGRRMHSPVSRSSGKLRLPFPAKTRHLGKAHPIAVMGGVSSRPDAAPRYPTRTGCPVKSAGRSLNRV